METAKDTKDANPVQHVITLSEYHELIMNNACVIKFTANWCGPCKRISPTYHKLAEEHKDIIKFLEVNIDSVSEITHEESIQSVPMFVFYYHGEKNKELEVRGASSAALTENVSKFQSLIQTCDKARIETPQIMPIDELEETVTMTTLTIESEEEEEVDLDSQINSVDEQA